MPIRKSAPSWRPLWRAGASAARTPGAPATTPTTASSARSVTSARARVTSADQLRDRSLDDGALEEVGIERGVQARRVLERELTEVVLADHPVLHELPRLLQHLAHVRHVEVTD